MRSAGDMRSQMIRASRCRMASSHLATSSCGLFLQAFFRLRQPRFVIVMPVTFMALMSSCLSLRIADPVMCSFSR